MVGIKAVVSGAPTLALGNVVGSNIANIWLVLGVPAILVPMTCTAPKFTSNMMIMLAATLMLIMLSYTGSLTFGTGIVLIMMLVAFIIFSTHKSQSIECAQTLMDMEALPGEPDSIFFVTALILGAIAGLFLGAQILVDGSVIVARNWGVSEAVIGLTIIALGTSLPELVTAIVAALRGACDVAIGNVIGSNIFNILGVLGAASLFGNIPIPEIFMTFDYWVMLIASLSLLPIAVFRMRIGRVSGIIYCTAYAIFIFYVAHGASAINHGNGMLGQF